MDNINIAEEFIAELDAEFRSTHKCLERIPESLFGFKPHEKSMPLGYLAQLVAEMPNWITNMIEWGEIDLATYPHAVVNTTAELVATFELNFEKAKKTLQESTNESLGETFSLKNNGQVMYSASKKINIASTLNHWVHHRGQLTVYMRLNDIAVPSIYGPSADEKGF